MISFSQFGEDLLVQEILGYERKDVFYIDIGAFHPISKSNSYIFYKRGGRGICVEPNPAAKVLWDRHRKRDIFLNAGATGGESGPMFYLPDPGGAGMNRFVNDADGGNGAHEGAFAVKCLNISELVKAHTVAGQAVDLLSIDCEGMDYEILANFPYDYVRPKVIVVEDFDLTDQSDLHQLLKGKGYRMVSLAKISKIFVDSSHSYY
jgi:FkbM family methyltransferase